MESYIMRIECMFSVQLLTFFPRVSKLCYQLLVFGVGNKKQTDSQTDSIKGYSE